MLAPTRDLVSELNQQARAHRLDDLHADDRGTVVAEGTPEEVAQVDASHTGVWLRTVLPSGPRGAVKVATEDGRPAKRKPRVRAS